MTIAPEELSPDEVAALLSAERTRLELAATESRQRLSRRLSELAGVVEAPAEAGSVNGYGHSGTVLPAGLVPAPAAPQPAGRAMALSRKLLVVGVIALVFWGYQRWITPWVGQNGQARLRSKGTPTLVAAKIGLDVAVGEGTGKSSLRRGPGHDPDSAPMDEAGNIVIAGHRSSYGAPFRKLDRLKKGDKITLKGREPVEFRVDSVKTGVPARESQVRAQRGVHRLTLVTGGANKRVVIVAKPVEHDDDDASAPVRSAGGALWPANLLSAAFFVALWAGAAAGLPILTGWLRLRWGRAPTLLAVVPAALVVAVGLFDSLEGLFGPLY